MKLSRRRQSGGVGQVRPRLPPAVRVQVAEPAFEQELLSHLPTGLGVRAESWRPERQQLDPHRRWWHGADLWIVGAQIY